MMMAVSCPFISCILPHRPQNCIPCNAPATKDYHELQLTPRVLNQNLVTSEHNITRFLFALKFLLTYTFSSVATQIWLILSELVN